MPVIFRGPLFSNPSDIPFQASWMLRPYGKISVAPSAVTNIYYKPYFITTGHMGFLGTY